MSDSTQYIKGMLAPIVLQLLSRHDKMYGYQITREVKEATKDQIVLTEGALYPCLHKLEADGLLTATFETIGNRKRKYYQLTRKGKKEAPKAIESIQEFWQQMSLIFNLQKA